MQKRKTIPVVLAALLLGAAARADLMPAQEADPDQVRRTPILPDAAPAPLDASRQLACLLTADLSTRSGSLLSEEPVRPEQNRQTPRGYILAERHSSVHLGLYALLGLGLCQSAPRVKRFSLGVIPAWYHEGGPFQIGPCLAVTPDDLTPALICCFLQPPCEARRPSSSYPETIVSLWRQSQWGPPVRTARGPPGRPVASAHLCLPTRTALTAWATGGGNALVGLR